MQNVNRFLENSWRSDLFGFQMASRSLENFAYEKRPEENPGGATPASLWDPPQPGLRGILALAHHVDVTDALVLKVTVDGKKTALHPMRNHWTPAWMETVYRSDIDPACYPNSGTLSIRDQKAILREDVFVSHMTLTNQKREASTVELVFSMPFEEAGDGLYAVSTKTMPMALQKNYPVRGFAALITDRGSRKVTVTIPPLGSVQLRIAMAYDPKDAAAAQARAKDALSAAHPFAESEARFNRWFAEHVPALECENSDLKKVYYYRWYLVYRSIHAPALWIDGHSIQGECMYESPFGGWYGTVVGLPIALQVGDAGWMRDSSVVKNQLTNWSRGTVAFQQYIQFTPLAAWRYYTLCRDRQWLASVYGGFADYCRNELKRGVPPLTEGSWITGAEYQPSFYQYTPEPWDWRYDEEGAENGFSRKALHRVDAVSFLILSLRGCIRMARELGMDDDAAEFSTAERELTDFVMTRMWDPEQEFFFSVDPEAGQRCDKAPCYDGFVPFIDHVAGERCYGALKKLWDADWFLSDYGALTTARNCPMFWYDNCIAGPTASSLQAPHEYGCCWNGPVWPFANSLIALGLGDAATNDPALQEHWLDFFKAFTELHFPYGDRSAPVICEHYRSDDGASFSQVVDYFHSSWIDLFMRYFAGISFDGETPAFRPFAKEPFTLSGVRLGSCLYDFIYTAEGKAEINEVIPCRSLH